MKSNTGFEGKPKALMCFICGREFGTNSLEIHIKQCEKKNNFKTPIPDNYNQLFDKINSGQKLKPEDYEGFNNKANDEYKDKSLLPCPNCERRFLPDRLEVHLRSCKGDQPKVKFSLKGGNLGKSIDVSQLNKTTTKNLGKSVDISQLNKRSGNSTNLFEEKLKSKLSEERSTNNANSSNNIKIKNPLSKSTILPPIKPKGPVFLVCYVCGREFGKHSLEIHLEKCMEKRVNEEINRGVPKKQIITPDPPQELIQILDKLQIKEEPSYEEILAYNQIAQEWYKNISMKACLKCNRKFAADRLDVHLKSCNPDQMNSTTTKMGGITSRPRLNMCPLCGREFGSLSLNIHLKTCIVRFNREQEQLPLKMRKSAETIIERFRKMEGEVKSNGNYNIDQLNDETYKVFSEEALAPCDLCGRTFLPDRLKVHQRSCKGPRK